MCTVQFGWFKRQCLLIEKFFQKVTLFHVRKYCEHPKTASGIQFLYNLNPEVIQTNGVMLGKKYKPVPVY